MNKRELLKRYVIFFIGLFINSFGVSFITKANLGTSPISSIPYTLSLGFAPTLGTFTLYMSIVLIVVQMILLRRKFPKQYFLQIPVSFLFSWFIDLSMNFLAFMNPASYLIRMVSLLLGCLILGVGVFLEMVADVVMLPGESFVNAVSITFDTDFGKTKVAFDVSMSVVAAAIGLILFHGFVGVREGTVIAALLVGMIARSLRRKTQFVQNFIENTVEEEKLKVLPASNNMVITISREFGSGGRKIGEALAKELGFNYYDKRIIEMTAEECGLSVSEVEKKDESIKNGFLYELFAQYHESANDETELDKLYKAETKIIRDVADNENCVIIGRCSDYILKDYKNCFKIFIYASDNFKTKNVMEREHLSRLAASEHIASINKKRFIHYKYYTGQFWGLSKNYHLSLDVSNLSVESAVDIISYYLAYNKHEVKNQEQAPQLSA